jgi:hypothetical protein
MEKYQENLHEVSKHLLFCVSRNICFVSFVLFIKQFSPVVVSQHSYCSRLYGCSHRFTTVVPRLWLHVSAFDTDNFYVTHMQYTSREIYFELLKKYTCLLTYIHTYLLTYLHTYLLACLLTYLLTYLNTYLYTCLLTYLLNYLLNYLLTYLITYLHTYLLTYLLTCLLTYLRT